MAFKYADGCAETTSSKPDASTGHTLSGALTGARTIVAGIGDGGTSIFRAEAVDANGNPSGAWEVFVGTVTDDTADTLSRQYLISRYDGGTSFIDWSAAGENTSPTIRLVAPAGQYHGYWGAPFEGGQWYASLVNQAPVSVSQSSGFLFLIPFFINRPCVLDGLAVDVQTAQSGGETRLGVYRDNGDGSPAGGDLVVDAGVIDAGTTGFKSITSLATFLAPGLYWAAAVGNNGSVQVRGINNSTTQNNMFLSIWGVKTAASYQCDQFMQYNSGSHGALSATCPAATRGGNTQVTVYYSVTSI